jgi:hypothetical protein
MHHTGKPSQDAKAKQHWTGSDFAYSGLGSSALTNWAREVAVLMRTKTEEGQAPTFRFELCKRRKRAGMTDTAGNTSESIFVRHGERGICWQQCEQPVEPQKKKGSSYKVGKRDKPGRPKVMDEAIPEFKSLKHLTKETAAELSAQYGVSIRTINRRWKAYRDEQEQAANSSSK